MLRLSRLLDPAPPGELGMGDDAALIAPRRGPWLLTTDAMVEGTHFNRVWFRPEEVGFKSLAANLSDAAAMGGRPSHAVVSLVLPPETSVTAVERLYRGMTRLARRERVALLGGNLARGEQFSVTISLLGDFPWGPPVLRDGARPGDRLYVSGQPGLAYLGFRLLEPRARGARDPWRPPPATEPAWRARAAKPAGARSALRRFLTPEPRLAMAQALRDLRPTALIDVSDGLAADLIHLAEAGTRLVVEPERLPLSPSFSGLARTLGESPEAAALHGGEDYELLFTLSPETAAALGPKARLAGVTITEIGGVEVGAAGAFLNRAGRPTRLEPSGFQHFKRS